MKKCPFCAEDIQSDAIKCKHCGEWLKVSKSKISGEWIGSFIETAESNAWNTTPSKSWEVDYFIEINQSCTLCNLYVKAKGLNPDTDDSETMLGVFSPDKLAEYFREKGHENEIYEELRTIDEYFADQYLPTNEEMRIINDRILCPDDACIGTVTSEGICTECGRSPDKIREDFAKSPHKQP